VKRDRRWLEELREREREIVYLVGHYCFISMTLNGFAIPVPDEN
jgi:hypothetical protein